MPHLDLAVLESRLGEVRASPRDEGLVELVVRRPAPTEREVLTEAVLDAVQGLIGNDWATRHNRHAPDGAPDPAKQLTLMNARAAALIAGDPQRWPLAGDQLFVDLDLSGDNLPVGTRLEIGSAVIAITDSVHRGCAKFAARFGDDALRFVRSQVGGLNLRGVHARVVTGGVVRTGDAIRKVAR